MSNNTYHYTIADRLVKILIDGHIKVMQESSKLSEDEPCLAWLTIRPEWDKTAFFGYPDDVLDNAGRVRITLPADYPSYMLFAQNIPQIDELRETAIHVGVTPSDWRVSLTPITIDKFIKIELWRGGEWVNVPFVKHHG